MGGTEMRIAVLSGKGGAGKTLVSVNLAAAAGRAVYVDCDVEEPNGHLFLKPEDVETTEITVQLPRFDGDKCTGCRKCVDFCRFNALAFIQDKPLLFPEVCHSCGGCAVLCPAQAVSEAPYTVGVVERGHSRDLTVLTGRMNPGNASGSPIIKALYRQLAEEKELTIMDCPPGSACLVMESIQDADYGVLVAEPTIFGAHNLAMVYELMQVFHKPFGVVLNKCTGGADPSEAFCQAHGIRILGRIPFEERLGRLNGNGEVAAWADEAYAQLFGELLQTILKEAAR